MASIKPKVLFLCTGNSCRSQMAEGWAGKLKAQEYEAFSAGTDPQGMNPLAVMVMQEVGISLSNHSSKHINQFTDIDWDLIVTVCDAAKEVCPVIPGARRVLHKSFDDPPKLAQNSQSEEQALTHYRRVRDQIGDFIKSTDFFNLQG